MPAIKVKVIKQYKQFEGFLDVGDEITLTPTLSTVEKIVCNELSYIDLNTREKIIAFPEVKAPVGTYEGFSFVVKGLIYTDKELYRFIGNVKLKNLFEKV